MEHQYSLIPNDYSIVQFFISFQAILLFNKRWYKALIDIFLLHDFYWYYKLFNNQRL